MLKPRDLAKVEFKRVWRGYSEKEVDEFVQKVVTEYEALYQKNQELEEEIRALKERIRKYEQSEGQLEEALALARQMHEDLKSAAEQRAAAIVAQARIQAFGVLRRARDELEARTAQVAELVRQEEAFRSRFRGLLESYWALLEEERREADQLSRLVQALTEAAAALEPVEGDLPAAGEEDAGDGAGPKAVPGAGNDDRVQGELEDEGLGGPAAEPAPGGSARAAGWGMGSGSTASGMGASWDELDFEETRRMPALGSRRREDPGEGEVPGTSGARREEDG